MRVASSLVLLGAVALLQACASGQGTSFATRVESSSFSDEGDQEAAVDDQSSTRGQRARTASLTPALRTGLLAASGNVLLPGAIFPVNEPLDSLSAGSSLTAALNGSINLSNGPGGPQVSVGLGGALNAADLPGSGAVASLTQPLAGAAGGVLGGGGVLGSVTQPAAGAAASVAQPAAGALQSGAPLISAGAGGASVAGQPLTQTVGQVLGGGASALGSTTSSVGAIASGANPGNAASQVLNAVGGAVSKTTPPAAGAGSGASNPTAGLGAIAGMLPGRRRP